MSRKNLQHNSSSNNNKTCFWNHFRHGKIIARKLTKHRLGLILASLEMIQRAIWHKMKFAKLITVYPVVIVDQVTKIKKLFLVFFTNGKIIPRRGKNGTINSYTNRKKMFLFALFSKQVTPVANIVNHAEKLYRW